MKQELLDKNYDKHIGVKKQDKLVGAGLVITPDQNQFLMFKTRPPDVGLISTHLLRVWCFISVFSKGRGQISYEIRMLTLASHRQL